MSERFNCGRAAHPADRQVSRKTAPLSTENIEALSAEEIRQVLCDLRVHQIELEMQNEELRSKQAKLDAAHAHHFDFYDLAPVGYCTISVQGLILAANLTIATLLGVTRGALINQPITRFIHKEDQNIYYLHRKQLFDNEQEITTALQDIENRETDALKQFSVLYDRYLGPQGDVSPFTTNL
jgi:PAS domain-containing protein